jgi:CRISPR/Cas system-associated protein Cas10 (large subunit of type III CRISPR-Cas system)
MEYSKINYFENAATPKHRDFIISQNNCALCGTVLELTHTSEPETDAIKEEAFCPHCEVKTSARKHILN